MVTVRGQLVRGDAVFAGQVVQAAQAALHGFELGRVGLQVVAHAVEQGQRFFDLDDGAVQQCVHFAQPRFVLGDTGDIVAAVLQQTQRAGAVVAVELLGDAVAGPDQRGGMRLAAMVDVQRGDRGRVQVLAFQFGQLVLQKADPVGDIALRRQRIALVQQRLPALAGLAHLFALGAVTGIGIEQGELAVAGHQRLMFVLAVDFDQPGGQFRQLRGSDRAAIDPGARAAVGADDPAQLTLRLVIEFVVGQPAQARMLGRQLEFGRQFGAVSAVADHTAVGAQARQKAQRVHHQRLAGTGFTRDHGHAWTEFEFGGADNGEILDREVSEHEVECERFGEA